MKYPDDFINKIICGDCLEVMKDMPNECVDLVLTDPPYGYDQFGSWSKEKANDFWISLMPLCKRIMKPGASFYSFTGWKYYVEARQALEENLKYLKTLIWDKRTFIGTRGDMKTLTYHNISEPIILGYRNDAELIFNLENVRIPTIHQDPRSNPKGKRPGDIIHQIALRNNDLDKLNHKGQKPMEILNLFIKASSNERQIVLDPFLGSGTTAEACKLLKRNFIGIEINPDYCKIAEERLAQGVL